MKAERLNELKAMVAVSVIDRYTRDDLTALIDAEIHRIESKRKVKLMPCKCGSKRVGQWRTQGDAGRGFVYECEKCNEPGKWARTDREAREAWNRMVSQ